MTSLLLAHFQTMYQMRPHCHVGEGFFNKWCENIENIGLSNDDEVTLLAHAVLVFKNRLELRIHFGGMMLEYISKIAEKALEYIRRDKKA